jgi:hypothetical protein
MAGLGNLNMSDMKWIGEPLDVVGQYQKGVNLAEQGQRMQQSADMHPLKMEDTKARTNLVKQAGEYNLRTMDSRVGLSDSMARLKQTAASISENTQYAQEDIITARGMQDMVNAQVAEATILSKTDATRSTNLMAVQRQQRDLDTNAAQIRNTRAVADINHSNAYVAQQTQDNKIKMYGHQVGAAGRVAEIDKRNLDDYNAQLPNMQIELNGISNMSYADLKDYEIPADISHAAHRLEIGRHLAQRKGTDLAADYQREINQANNLDQQRLTRQLGVQNKLNDTTGAILELKDTYGNPLFRNVDSDTLTPAGVAMLGKLERSSVVYDKLNASNKAEIRNAMRQHRGMSLFPTGLGETLTGQYGAEYDTQIVLDEAGIAKANEMLVGQDRAAKISQNVFGATLGLRISEMKDGVMTFSNGAVMDNSKRTEISKLILARRKEWITAAGPDDEGNDKAIPDSVGRNIATAVAGEVGLAGMTVAGSFNSARAAGLQPGSPFIDPRTGKISIIPKTTGAGGTTVLKKTLPPKSTQLTGDANDLMMGVGGYTTKEAMAKAIKRDEDGSDGNWAARGFIFNGVRGKLTQGSDAIKDADARFITSLVIGNEWKTGHGVGAAFKWVFQDDPDAEDNPTEIMKYVVPHGREKQREAMDALKIAVFGEDILTIDQGKVITNDQLVRLTSAVKKHPNDISKWPLLENTQPGIGVKRGKENYTYSAKSAAAIVKQSSKWRKWSDFNGRIKNLK